MKFATIVPFAFIILALVAPSLMLAPRSGILPPVAALGVARLLLNVRMFNEIASKLTHNGACPLKL